MPNDNNNNKNNSLRVDPKDGSLFVYTNAFPKNNHKGVFNELMLLQVLLSFSSQKNPLRRDEIANLIAAFYGLNVSNKIISLAWKKIKQVAEYSYISWFECDNCGRNGIWARLKNVFSPYLAVALLVASFSCNDIGNYSRELVRKLPCEYSKTDKAMIRNCFQLISVNASQRSDYAREDVINNQLAVIIDAISNKKVLMFDHCLTGMTCKRIYGFSPYKVYMKADCFYVLGSVESRDSKGKECYYLYMAKLIHLKDIKEDEDSKYVSIDDACPFFSVKEDLKILQPYFISEGELDVGFFHKRELFEGVVSDRLLNFLSANFSETLVEMPLEKEHYFKGGHHVSFHGQKELVLGVICAHIDDIFYVNDESIAKFIDTVKGCDAVSN